MQEYKDKKIQELNSNILVLKGQLSIVKSNSKLDEAFEDKANTSASDSAIFLDKEDIEGYEIEKVQNNGDHRYAYELDDNNVH